jgi:hypothetical protein
MKKSGMGSHQSNNCISVEWIPPKEIVDTLGPFVLDPCAAVDMPWQTADIMVTSKGLEFPWKCRVWLNPPYGKETGVWLKKMVDHGNGIALIFARTETQMFFDSVWGEASALLFLKGRISFYKKEGGTWVQAKANSGAPSVLIAYDKRNPLQMNKKKLKAAASVLNGQFVDLTPVEMKKTWAQQVEEILMMGPLTLDRIYEAAMRIETNNRHWKPKIRQTLYRGQENGRFTREGELWRLKDE